MSIRKQVSRIVIVLAAVMVSAVAFAADEKPCATNPEVRQLDYWLGSWTVTNPGSSGSSTSKVSLSLDKCLFVETWQGNHGHTGQDMFAYSADAKNWYGMFADSEGRVHIFTSGKVANGTAEFDGPSLDANGTEEMNRVKLVRVGPGKLTQAWEKSSDRGATWKTVFSGEYLRAK
jgi:hypothetical protein